MSICLLPTGIYGSIQHKDDRFTIVASKIDNKWYASLDGIVFDAGFCNINNMSNFYDKFEEYEESLNMLGYFRNVNIFINDIDDRFYSEISIKDNGVFEVSTHIEDGSLDEDIKYTSDNFKDVESHILELYDRLEIDILASDENDELSFLQSVKAAISSRDLAKNLVRVKSSNIWSYGINLKDRKAKTGDVLVQFKDKHGGAGDIYEYFDVPVNLWRRWLSAPSKGHFFWQYIRNTFYYRKLTGDKRGKLKNAIN